ncbi:hypothetical protein [Pseudovibrio flavus]|uniref:hypothetical protein n=1 Tax=Pseudovibrio flavus TaxID=2529854 RepID=UPI0035294B83
MPPGELLNGSAQPQAVRPNVAPDKATFAFDRFTGAPGNVSDDLARYVATVASQKNLKLVRRVGAPATYRVKGFLSATGSQDSSVVFYVFDIVDANGNRLQRIEGQESSEGGTGDPWAHVTRDTLERIAARSVVAIEAWLYSS